MSQVHAIRSYDYINRPYPQVSEVLRHDAPAIMQAATKAASARAESVAAELRMEIAGVNISSDIIVTVTNIEDGEDCDPPRERTRISLTWEAAKKARLFPIMDADLTIYPLTDSETQLDFLGNYVPPLGLLGEAIHAVAGHRVADATVHRFLSDLARHLREHLD